MRTSPESSAISKNFPPSDAQHAASGERRRQSRGNGEPEIGPADPHHSDPATLEPIPRERGT